MAFQLTTFLNVPHPSNYCKDLTCLKELIHYFLQHKELYKAADNSQMYMCVLY